MGSYDEKQFVDRDKELRGFRKLLKPETPQAVMLIEASELMGKTWLIGQMSGRCREEVGAIPVVTIDFKDALERHKVQDTLSLVRLIRKKIGYPQYFYHLDTIINSLTVAQRGAGVAAIMPLIEKMERVYNLEELERLALWLEVVWENLPGDTLFEKAKGLVMRCQRLGNLSALIDRLETERPQVNWRQGLESLLGEPKGVPDDDAATSEWIVRDHGDPLPTEGRDLAEARINEAFLACLQRLTADVKPIVFLFDGCEEAPDEAEKWIRVQLLDRLVKGELNDAVIIFAARKVPYRLDLVQPGIIVKTRLDGFDEERVREFFEVHGVQVDPVHLPVLALSSGGNPGMLARMVDNLRAKRDKEDPFFQ
jgi:hypothetical protein